MCGAHNGKSWLICFSDRESREDHPSAFQPQQDGDLGGQTEFECCSLELEMKRFPRFLDYWECIAGRSSFKAEISM